MTKLGGFVGAVLLIALLLTEGPRIDFLNDVNNDFVATAIIVAVGVIGALLGSGLVRQLKNRHTGHSAGTGSGALR